MHRLMQEQTTVVGADSQVRSNGRAWVSTDGDPAMRDSRVMLMYSLLPPDARDLMATRDWQETLMCRSAADEYKETPVDSQETLSYHSDTDDSQKTQIYRSDTHDSQETQIYFSDTESDLEPDKCHEMKQVRSALPHP